MFGYSFVKGARQAPFLYLFLKIPSIFNIIICLNSMFFFINLTYDMLLIVSKIKYHQTRSNFNVGILQQLNNSFE